MDVEYTGIVLSNRDGTDEIIGGIPVVASLETAADYICREWVDEVFVYPAHLTDIEVHRSELYKSVEGFINNAYSDFAKKNYTEQTEKTIVETDAAASSVAVKEQEEATVSSLIESSRQMAIPYISDFPSPIWEKGVSLRRWVDITSLPQRQTMQVLFSLR